MQLGIIVEVQLKIESLKAKVGAGHEVTWEHADNGAQRFLICCIGPSSDHLACSFDPPSELMY